ncbi:hypothetical protein F5Y10DRAFT_52664 [Nemania abortiva]|nr:hypothetical protein F5Y10DRAFT_52664 [Nemania abortiva]
MRVRTLVIARSHAREEIQSAQRTGPFTLAKKAGELAYGFNFPRHWRVHRVVSVARLFPAPKGTDPFGRRQPPGRLIVEGYDDDYVSYEIEALLKTNADIYCITQANSYIYLAIPVLGQSIAIS